MQWVLSGIDLTLIIVGYLVWFAVVLRHRLRSPAMRRLTGAERLRQLGMGILLLPAVVGLVAIPTNVRTVLVVSSAGLALAGWTFLPPRLRSKVMAVALVLCGVFTLLVLRAFIFSFYNFSQFNSVPGFLRVGAFPQILLFEAFALIAGGLWLTWRAIDKDGFIATLVLRERPRVAGQIGRPRWGLLSLVALALMAELLLQRSLLFYPLWTAVDTTVVALVALALVFGFPAASGDAAVAGLVLFGLYGIAVAVGWPAHLPLLSPYTSIVHYGPIWVNSGLSAIGAGALGFGLTGFGLWLAPRALDDRTKGLFRTATEADLSSRVVRLTRTRADAVDSATAQLRRLERDLHDGAQARLVALGMSLRAAEHLIPTSPEVAVTLVAEARQTSAKVLDELRDLVRGMCPPVLADRGLADAVRALALDTPLRTDVDIELAGRPDLPVETACYFAVAEALTNAVKHSGARMAQIRIWHADGSLRISVIDDGMGGADPQRGSGLLGLERRLAPFDGVLAVNSPPGGPTIVAIEVPCALALPGRRISS